MSKTLTKTDVGHLKTIANQRFELLKEQHSQRRREAERVVRDQIEVHYDSVVKDAEKEFKSKVLKKFEEAEKAWADFKEEYAEKGVEPGYTEELSRPNYDRWDKKYGGFHPIDIDKKTRELYNKIREDKGIANLSLEEQRLNIIEQLMLDAIETDAAKDFLAQIPTIESYVPLPEAKEVKALLP